MMIVPRRSEFDLFDDMFKDPFFNHEGHHKVRDLMKTDIVDCEDNYSISIDLPGYEKENIKIDIENGYLTVNAVTVEDNSKEKDKYVCKERYYGSVSRTFYVGEDVEVEDVKANFKNGVLTLVVPKIEKHKELPEKKYVEIE